MSNSELYDYILKNRKYFISSNNSLSKDEKYKKWMAEKSIKVPIHITEQNLYDYLTDNRGKICKCGKVNKFDTFARGYYKFCSKTCLHQWRSDNMKGEGNAIRKMTPEQYEKMNKKISNTIKSKIAKGEWTPCVTNSWAKSRCEVNINRNGKKVTVKCRSSWDAYFQIKNPNMLYEKIRIPYEWKGEFRNYIIDFVDIDNKVIYEIKPNNLRDSELNITKFSYAKRWAKSNNYDFVVVDDLWFRSNFNTEILKGQPEEDRINRLLKQFNEDKIN